MSATLSKIDNVKGALLFLHTDALLHVQITEHENQTATMRSLAILEEVSEVFCI